jgi:hypothetical protein
LFIRFPSLIAGREQERREGDMTKLANSQGIRRMRMLEQESSLGDDLI